MCRSPSNTKASVRGRGFLWRCCTCITLVNCSHFPVSQRWCNPQTVVKVFLDPKKSISCLLRRECSLIHPHPLSPKNSPLKWHPETSAIYDPSVLPSTQPPWHLAWGTDESASCFPVECCWDLENSAVTSQEGKLLCCSQATLREASWTTPERRQDGFGKRDSVTFQGCLKFKDLHLSH